MCAYMCVWTSLFLVSNNHLELPNRVNLDSKSIQFKLKYRLLGPSVAQQGPRGSQESAKTVCASILDPYWISFRYGFVPGNVFSRVFPA